MNPSKLTCQDGYTLAEIIIVVALLGLFASVMIPSYAPAKLSQLELSVSQIADAIRFAKSEAIRTGNPHGIDTNTSTNTVRVFKADVLSSPPARTYDVYHPIKKNLYSISLDSQTVADLTSINLNATYRTNCNQPQLIIFDENGAPFCGDPYANALIIGTFTLYLDNYSQTIQLTGGSSQVSIQ